MDNFQKWNVRFMRLALEVSSWSRDPSTKVGCVIVRDKRIISTGYNGFPVGIDDTKERLNDREKKYPLVVHAEMNAILYAKQDISDCFLYTTHYPCENCAKVIVQSGIKKIFYNEIIDRDHGYKNSDIMFDEVGIYRKKIDVKL